MRKFKKFVSTAIIAAMAGTLCLTGCGSNSSSEAAQEVVSQKNRLL